MKKIKLLLTLCLFLSLPKLEIMARPIDPDPDSFEFKKTVEPAMIAHGLHNTKGKNSSHQKFFPEYNGRVEFFMNHSFKGSSGFRIDSLDESNYRLEVKCISNQQEVLEKLRNEFPLKSIKAGESSALTKEEKKEIAKYNQQQAKEMYAEASEKYEIETKEISVSRSFGDKLHEITTLLIESHVNKEIPRISKDGYTAIFRSVVGEEVWDFSAKNPSGVFKELTNICSRIVESVKENGDGINEKKYISLLDSLVESDCEANLVNIFKAHDLRMKYETVLFIYKHRDGGFCKNDTFLNSSFQLIKGLPYFKEQKDSISDVTPGELVKVEFMSKEDMSLYIEQLNYTPEEALKEYEDLVRNIQFEKEKYLNCIEIELAKGNESEYLKEEFFYSFRHPWSSLLPPRITGLDYLKIFKEFVLNDNQKQIPDSIRAYAFLNCGCKIPPFVLLSPHD